MYQRLHSLSLGDMYRLHSASMEILRDVGVTFHDPEALQIFNDNGFRIKGRTVFFTERDVRMALSSAPAQFEVTGRDPATNITIGGDEFVFAPGSGPPFIIDGQGEQRPALMEDFQNLCKLVHTSTTIDLNSSLMVEPCDIDARSAYLEMFRANLTMTAKPMIGCAITRQACRDSVEMAKIVFGGKHNLIESPVMIGIISPSSPLQYSLDAAGALIEYARFGQPLLIACCVMAGSSGPISMAGVVALQNAEILAGITLSQLIRPGLPIIYGAVSCPLDLRSGSISIGAPETAVLADATAQMARYYDLPSRGGGDLTDAHFPDIQAGMESALIGLSAVRSGINLILHSCGILASFLAMSYEKWIADEEMCRMIRKVLQPIEVSDEAIDLEAVKRVGIGGQYLTQRRTLQKCRTEYFIPEIMNRQGYANWKQAGKKRADVVAAEIVERRLAAYVRPNMDPDVENRLNEYVERRKQEIVNQ